jgi:hypothetical protein
LKINTNLVELSLYSGLNSQQKFDFICDDFTQLKSFCFHGLQFTSISNLIKLINLEHFELIIDRIDIEFSSMDKNNCFNNWLKSLKLINIEMTPTLFERLLQMFPNIEKLLLCDCGVICEHQNYDKYDCFQCLDKAFNYLSKLNRLKALEIIPFRCETLKAIESNINEQTFKQLVELKLRIFEKSITVDNESKQIFIDLIQSLTQLCDRNTKQLFTFKLNDKLKELISEKQIINGIEYNVFFDCEKFEKNYGKKFEIPKNFIRGIYLILCNKNCIIINVVSLIPLTFFDFCFIQKAVSF